MGVVTGGGGGGGSSRPALPIADPTGVVVNTTTYNNPFTGSGKLSTLVFPGFGDTGLLAVAIGGEAFPRTLISSDPTDGWYFGDGSVDARSGNAMAFFLSKNAADGSAVANFVSSHGDLAVGAHDPGGNRGFVDQHGLGVIFRSAAMATSASGVPGLGGEVGDMYIRQDGGDGSWLYRCTVAGAAGAATWVAKL